MRARRCLFLLALAACDCASEPPPPISPLPERLEIPREGAAFYWVGHSLMSHRDRSADGSSTLPELVGQFAASREQRYEAFEHLNDGASFLMNWEDETKRRELEERGESYDVLVLTPQLTLVNSFKYNAPAHWARRFVCLAQEKNPSVDVFLYETWHHLEASDRETDYPPPQSWNWRQRLDEDRSRWLQLADQIAQGPAPNDEGEDPPCEPEGPVKIIPVGRALGMAYDQLHPRNLEVQMLFQNPHRRWPEDWPVTGISAWLASPDETLAEIPLVHPNLEFDDIHPSQVAIYISALVHYATVYRQSPVGLDPMNGVDRRLARKLQRIAWEAVLTEPRSGVKEE